MALHYQFGWDFARIGSASVSVDDGISPWSLDFVSGLYAHSDIAYPTSAPYGDFVSALQTAMNDGITLVGSGASCVITWSLSTGYTFTFTGVASITMTFTGTVGTVMKQILGFTGDRSGGLVYSSQVRPYYLILPAIQGRTDLSDDRDPEGIATEQGSDDGTIHTVAVENVSKEIDWQQTGEIDTAPAAFSNGTPPHKRRATSNVPWTYEHAWEHHRTGFDSILVTDGSEVMACQMRASGASFRPTRMGGADFGLWSIPWRVWLLGRS